MTTACRYDAETKDYLTPDGDRCRHDEYGDPTHHCTARKTCNQHVGLGEQTCARCIGRTRTNIKRLIELAPVYTLLADEDRRGDRETLSLAGPIAYFPTWQWRFMRRRIEIQDAYEDQTELLKKHIDRLDAERDDDMHPTLLLARWVGHLATAFKLKPPTLTNIATLGDWLDDKLGKFAQDPDQEFGQFAAEVRQCLNHVEYRLSLRGDRKTIGVSCPTCAIEGHKARLVRLYAHWCEDPNCERIHVADESADIWRCPRDRTHEWKPEQYERYLKDRRSA